MLRNRILMTAIAYTAACLLPCTRASGQIAIDWYTVDGGGQTFSTGGSLELGGTLGQPDAQAVPVMTGGTLELTGGFWPVTQVCTCLGDLNGDSNKDGLDIQLFLNCVLAGGSCSCADVDAMNGLTPSDVPAFVDSLLNGPGCP